MKKIIETERLYLRTLSIKDATLFYLLNLDKDVLKYTGDKSFKSIESAQKFLENYDHYSKYGFGRWAVINKQNEEFLGWCGLKFTASKNEYDIGFRFFKKHWNKGYATEAAKSCVDFGINNLKLKEIIGRAMKENKASIKVLKKIGLKYSQDFDFEGNKGVIYKTE
ncbi:GNAT family N-acetyltransferase [Lutibacter sp. A80]|uniref:GNAT family N-acetyltransferase n=1 Tax=Lutibacter sp. A80 TaxID=2918453 RepID=UPI001F050C0B|nr:GNAT family N-acetyltransferase [Lutibacter sp. A80]UMB61627.1 GNAT family N-acetyltransferase [Lutibacter sp. A80]